MCRQLLLFELFLDTDYVYVLNVLLTVVICESHTISVLGLDSATRCECLPRY